MNHDQIKDTTTSHYRKLKKYSRQIIKDFETEAIHNFRVEYKKLRAFFRMLSIVPGNTREIKISKGLKKTYRISGALRDLQLHEQRIQEATKHLNKKPEEYFDLLAIEMEKLKPELTEILTENPVEESKETTNYLLPSKFDQASFQLFSQKIWIEINAIILSGRFTDENIHAIRKKLKDLFYILQEYDKAKEVTSRGHIAGLKNEEHFNKLLEELGNFQDICTAITLLRSYWLNRLNLVNRQRLMRVKKIWLQEKLTMKQHLVNKLKNNLYHDGR